MFDDTVATIVGWAMIGALPALLAINMVLQGLNRPYRKHLHKQRVAERWAQILNAPGKVSEGE